MGLFDKKYCDICGEKIGLLGNRKLEDGNLCKDCAKKLSPWFSERRSSTVAEIKGQLDWREANQERASRFRITRSFGEKTKLLLDENQRWFTVTRAKNPAEDNSDVLDFSVITGCRMDIDETRNELKHESKDREGKTVRKSYDPPRYEYYYDFYIIISVNVPYFTEMKFKLNDGRVHISYESAPTGSFGGGLFQSIQSIRQEPMYDARYRNFTEMGDEICNLLNRIISGEVSGQQAASSAQSNLSIESLIPGLSSSPAAKKAVEEVFRITTWRCATCGCPNSNTLTCQQCGAPFSDEEVLTNLKNLAFAAAMGEGSMTNDTSMPTDGAPQQNNVAMQSWSCPSCGAQNSGKFCESCGTKRP